MTKKSFSSAETRLLARISQDTLERYVRDFAKFFSPAAQIHTRGRKFNERDLKNVLLIKRMHFSRNTPDQITTALIGEEVDPLGQDWLELDDIARIAAETLEMQKNNERRLIKIEQRLFGLETMVRKYR